MCVCVCVYIYIYIYTHILSNVDCGGAKEIKKKKKEDTIECCVPKEIFLHPIGSPTLRYAIVYITFLYFNL